MINAVTFESRSSGEALTKEALKKDWVILSSERELGLSFKTELGFPNFTGLSSIELGSSRRHEEKERAGELLSQILSAEGAVGARKTKGGLVKRDGVAALGSDTAI